VAKKGSDERGIRPPGPQDPTDTKQKNSNQPKEKSLNKKVREDEDCCNVRQTATV